MFSLWSPSMFHAGSILDLLDLVTSGCKMFLSLVTSWSVAFIWSHLPKVDLLTVWFQAIWSTVKVPGDRIVDVRVLCVAERLMWACLFSFFLFFRGPPQQNIYSLFFFFGDPPQKKMVILSLLSVSLNKSHQEQGVRTQRH